MEAHWLSSKENVSMATVSKEGHTDSLEGHTDSLVGHERIHHLISLEKLQL